MFFAFRFSNLFFLQNFKSSIESMLDPLMPPRPFKFLVCFLNEKKKSNFQFLIFFFGLKSIVYLLANERHPLNPISYTTYSAEEFVWPQSPTLSNLSVKSYLLIQLKRRLPPNLLNKLAEGSNIPSYSGTLYALQI